MSGFIVDESRFLISDENEQTIPLGYTLPGGIRVGEIEDESDCYELYFSDDGRYYILSVAESLYTRWNEAAFTKAQDYMHLSDKSSGVSLYLLICRTTHKICRLTSLRNDRSKRFALNLFAAFVHTRSLDMESNLRDGIYLEKWGLILPTYSLVGAVSDRALYENALRGANSPEDLRAPDGLNDGLSFPYVKRLLKQKGLMSEDITPLFDCGATEEGFSFGFERNVLLTAPVALHRNYQIYDTATDSYILVMNRLFAEALISVNMLSMISLNTISIDGSMYYCAVFKKDFALESMDDRIYGLDKDNAVYLAQAIRRTRAKLPQCSLKDALYVESLGLLLPSVFNGADDITDRALMAEVLTYGPFALSPLMDDIAQDVLFIASR